MTEQVLTNISDPKVSSRAFLGRLLKLNSEDVWMVSPGVQSFSGSAAPSLRWRCLRG